MSNLAVILLPVWAMFSALLTGWVRRYALARSILDVPNERSSHRVATPRGGGIAIVVCWLGVVLLGSLAGIIPARTALVLAVGGGTVGTLGWLDDRFGLSPGVRLVVQLLVSTWTVAGLGDPERLRLGGVIAPAAGFPLAVLGLAWMINLYNFMDGIDGLAGVEAFTVALAAGAILWSGGFAPLAYLSLGLGACALGFLIWNLPPARIFMGDVGSGFLGYAFGALALAADRAAPGSLLVFLILLSVFVLDATFTLLRRLARGEKFYEAHRSHAYQRLVQSGWSHGQVTGLVFILNLLLAGWAWFVWSRPQILGWGTAGAFAVLLAAGALLLAERRGRTIAPVC